MSKSFRCCTLARRRLRRRSPRLWRVWGGRDRRVPAAVQSHTSQRTATLDVDVTMLEAHKRTATVVYNGTRGYQPVIAVWDEQDLIVHDEFRDGNVPAAVATCGPWGGPSRPCHPESRRSLSGGIVPCTSRKCAPGVSSMRTASAMRSVRI